VRIQGRIHQLQRQLILAALADEAWHTHQALEAALGDARAADDLPARLVELERAGRRIETHRHTDGALHYRLQRWPPASGPDGPNVHDGGAA
jgi:hypothetical protein